MPIQAAIVLFKSAAGSGVVPITVRSEVELSRMLPCVFVQRIGVGLRSMDGRLYCFQHHVRFLLVAQHGSGMRLSAVFLPPKAEIEQSRQQQRSGSHRRQVLKFQPWPG